MWMSMHNNFMLRHNIRYHNWMNMFLITRYNIILNYKRYRRNLSLMYM